MKKIFTISGLMFLLLVCYGNVFSQKITVTGKVTDASTGESLPSVSVVAKGTSLGTISDANGFYSISVSPSNSLTYSFIGYESQTIAVAGRTTINVSLTVQSNELQQVVVVGYGTQRKIDVTGSVTQVKGEEISKQASINPLSALQGKVAGLQIVNSGAPGASPQVTIRGTGTIFGNTTLLYIVDGVWYDDISFLNPADIESMSVLKDASSTAIYGLRVANGAIVITTKKGVRGTTTVNYNAYAGWQHVTNPVKMASASEYATLINETYNINKVTPLLFADPTSYGNGTEWYNQILHDAFTTNHEVSINGGTDKAIYNFSLGYLDQNGNVKNNNYKRYTARMTTEYEPVKNLKFGYAIGGTYSNSTDTPDGIFHQLYGAAPIVPVYYADGTYGDPSDFNIGNGNNYNPQVTLDYYNQKSQHYRFNGNVYGELKFLRHFTFRTSFGGDYAQDENRNYSPVYTATQAQRSTSSVLSINRTTNRNWIVENTLKFNNQFGSHNLTVLLGQTAQQYKYYTLSASARNVPNSSEGDLYLSLGDVGTRNVVDDGSLRTALSYFGRVNYSFKDKYLLNASLRADAGSQFYGNNLWAYLPAVGAGWVITNESFMKEQHLFNNLKLRASYGRTGNAGVPYNPTVLQVTQLPQYTAFYGTPQSPNTGASIVTIVPPSIKIERADGTDVGLEGAVLNNHLNFEFDYYNRLTKDAIFPLPILNSLGTGTSNNTSSSGIIGNQATFRNRGAEAVITYKNSTNKDFTYSISGNFAYNTNIVLSVASGNNPIYNGGNGIANGQLATRTVVGEPIGEFYGYKVTGIFQTDAQIAASKQTSAKVGDFIYNDTNNDGVIDSRDRVTLGNPNPKYNYGINTSFTYKNFDLALDFQGVAGVSIYNANIAYRYGNENYTQDFFDHRWHGAGTSNSYPSANVGSTANAVPNSFYVESGAYFRVRNVQLGYTLSNSMLTKLRVKKLRFYANAQNPLNFFKYKGFSPEVGGTPTNAGIDANVYPLYSTYNFGVNVTF
ncbi:MAG: TonB-dependent receptor [Bacteroidetes bacterium]|nr:TonB-dependent receptor [Bacteroidota bacterium]